ncbi:MAG: SGNH/GDSL hydrolase family protein [Planctomycetes bacterium]|nr:SGNH/GDSL hydrolase family protein [Planctomycetota bacterium]
MNDSTNPALPRRTLLSAGTAALSAAALGACAGPRGARRESGDAPGIAPGSTILFQGDSITDCERALEDNAAPNLQANLGFGYAWLAAAGELVDRPDDDLRFLNRALSGNKVYQLAERWDADCLALAPDLLSILIGVNDIWHARGGTYDGTVEVYERDYDALLTRTRDALPRTRLVVCEPFVLRCGSVDDTWFPEFDHYRAAARRVADAHGATFVAFHAMFERALTYAPPEHWAEDGVHPTSAGAALMAQTWRRVVGG